MLAAFVVVDRSEIATTIPAMSYTLDATVGGASANSYVTLEEANTIVSEVFAILTALGIDTTGWDAIGSPEDQPKTIALITAAKRIDNLPWVGVPLTTTQAMAWPRQQTDVVPIENANPTIPEDVKWAQVAEACALLLARSDSSRRSEQGIASETFGEKSVTYRQGPAPSTSYSEDARRVAIASGLVQSGFASVAIART